MMFGEIPVAALAFSHPSSGSQGLPRPSCRVVHHLEIRSRGLLSVGEYVVTIGMIETPRHRTAPKRSHMTTGDSGVPADADRWLDAARAGQGDGFDGLYRWLGGPITSFARSRRAADPEGVANDVFLKAFRSIQTFEGTAATFRSWIFATTRNHLIDEIRKQQRRPQTADGVAADVATPDTTEAGAFLAIGNERVEVLLSCLTDAQRDVVVLRIIGDLSLNDVADIVGRPISAVKRLQARALRRLEQKILDEAVSQ